jgi:glyoxylase-like metal-dependent hydrolase (beta-lactamase superfamily II)
MQPTPLIRVLDDVFRWSVWNEPRGLWFNGHALVIGEITVLIDPVPMTDEVAAALPPPAVCVVTNRDHLRAVAEVRERFGVRLLLPRGDAAQMALPADALIDDGEVVAAELRVVGVPHAKTPGELALYWPARRLLVLGDAAIGRPAGALSMLPDDKLADPAAARTAVAHLAGLDVDVVLVGDGDDVLDGGTDALAALGGGPARAPAGGGAPGC